MVVFSLPTVKADGSIGRNQDGFHSVDFQRPFGNHVVSALVKQDEAELSSAIKAIEFCYQHQNADGSFQVVQIRGAAYTLNTDPIVGTAFFYADLGHALALLHDSQWFMTDPSTSALRQRIEALRPGIARGLHWLSAPSQEPTVENTGKHDTNRGTFGAEAFILTGEWLGDSSAIATGEELLRQAEGNLQPDGTILEKGGFDSGYQSVSLANLFHIYFHLAPGEESQRPALWNIIVKGTAREQLAILATGEVSHTANSRTYCGGESFRGKQKQGGGDDVVRVLAYMSGITGNVSLLTTAQGIVHFYATHPHNLCSVP